MAEILKVSDLPESITEAIDEPTLDDMVAALNAKATRLAPCLDDADADLLIEARMLLRSIITRWVTDGVSAKGGQETSGPASLSTVVSQPWQVTGWRWRPSEITEIQSLCESDSPGVGSLQLMGGW